MFWQKTIMIIILILATPAGILCGWLLEKMGMPE